MRPPRPHPRLSRGQPLKTWRHGLATIGIAAAATAIALVACDWGARLVLNPADFLSPTLVRDDVLGIRVAAGSSGHDPWGFRNRSVPATADVVALGDSHTYGNRATTDDAWPSVLARLTGKRVYNLGMGGYGPNQYYHLLQARALSLKPRTIICGLYLGDDFANAFHTTYGLDHWSSLRRPGIDPDNRSDPRPTPATWHQAIRQWLSRNSMLYRLVFHGLLQTIKGRYQIQNASWLYENTTSLVAPDSNVQEAFIPYGPLRGLDPELPSVREGMGLTFRLLQDMNALCARHDIQFIVAVIPTKETVYSRHLEHNPAMTMHGIVDRVIASERIARQKLFAKLDQAGIRYVDVLPALVEASQTERIYIESAIDMHPNRNGYRVIAEVLSRYLSTEGAGRAS